MSEPLVSIVIPCYNAAGTVGEAIESALAQTYSQTEVIVIDDGSTDDSIRVLESHDGRIRWETGPNRGACAARNRGIELAQGEFIQFLDADDLLEPTKIQIQSKLITTDSTIIPFSNSVVFDSDGRPQGDFRPWHNDSFHQACFDAIPTPSTLHWKKNLAAVGGFTFGLPCSQERDLHLRMACSEFQFQFHPEVLVKVRRQSGSVSSNLIRVLDQHSSIVDRAMTILRERGTATEGRLRALAGILARDGRTYLQHGEFEKANAAFQKAMQVHPTGGLEFAYTSKTRTLQQWIGPELTETLIKWRRQLGSSLRSRSYKRMVE